MPDTIQFEPEVSIDFEPEGPTREEKKAAYKQQKAELEMAASQGRGLENLAGFGERIANTVAQMHPLEAIRPFVNPYRQVLIPPEVSQKVVESIGGPAAQGSALQGVQQFASEMISGLSAPENVAAMVIAPSAPAAVGRLFQTEMAGAIPEQIQQLRQAQTTPEVVKAGLNLAATPAMMAGIEYGLSKPKAAAPTDIREPAMGSELKLPKGAERPPEPEIQFTPETKGEPNAESVRASEGQLPQERIEPKGVQETGGNVVEQKPSEQSQPVVQGGKPEAQSEVLLTPTLSQAEQNFGEQLAKKYGSPVSPVTPASEPYESVSRFRDMLERAADRSQDTTELDQILSAAKGKPDESRIAWAVANNPHAGNETFARAKANDALRSMTSDENIASLDETRKRLISEAKPSLLAQEKAPEVPAPSAATGELGNRTVEQPAVQPPAISETKPVEQKTQGVAKEPSAEPAKETKRQTPFMDWRIQGISARHSRIGQKLTPEEADQIMAGMAEREMRGRYDAKKGTVVLNSGMLDDFLKYWQESGSYGKKVKERQQIKSEKKAREAERDAATAKAISENPATSWIDSTFGKDNLNPYNKLALARFLTGEAKKFEGLLNWKWREGLEKLGALTQDKVNWEKVKNAYEAQKQTETQTPTPTPEQPVVESVPEGGGTIQGMGGATLGEKPTQAQIEQLSESFKGVQGEKEPLGARLKESLLPSERTTAYKDLLSRAITSLKEGTDKVISKWRGDVKIDDLVRAKGSLSAELEKRGVRVRQWVKQARKAVPSRRMQAAISKWVDAGGDRAALEQGYNETKPEFKQAYLDALNLKGDMLVAAENIRNYFDSRLQEAIDAGVLKEGVEDYIHRVYSSRPEVEKKAIATLQTGILRANPALIKKRVFDFDWQAEKEGYKPIQSFIDRIAIYESSLSRAIAAREFIRKATTMKAADGRPVIDVKGVGVPIEDPVTGAREATLIKPSFNPAKSMDPGTDNYRGDYVNKEFPALSKWKWVASDTAGNPILVQGDVAIHPDYAPRITALLEPSRLRYGKYQRILRPALGISGTIKQTMLDLSGFHQVQITVHGLEHKVLPWKIVDKIDFENPNVDKLLNGGITLGGDYFPYSSEGLFGNALTRHIPWLGPLGETYHNWLFQSYIPRIKMTMALNALERNRARYAGKLTDEQIAYKTAQQANSAFGELNYIMLERSKTARDLSRLILLAPDFLEARGRFALEALAKGGKSAIPGFGNEQRAALLLGALTMYITARIANKLVDDQYHFEPENLFSLVYKNHAYSMRTVQGDILHAIEHPLQFWLNRLNPGTTRPGLQLFTGRDYFGRQRTPLQTLADTAINMTPISLRHGKERKIWESLLNSFGVNARRYNAMDDAFKLAQDWKQKNGIGEPGEFIYDSTKDPLRGLKIALVSEDDATAAKEIKAIFDSGKYNRKKLNDYFKRYGNMRFTGSTANDRKWMGSLNEDQKQTVQAAVEGKRAIRDRYFKALGLFDAMPVKP